MSLNSGEDAWSCKQLFKMSFWKKRRPDTRQSSRGRLDRSPNAKAAQNSKMWRTDRPMDVPTRCSRVSAIKNICLSVCLTVSESANARDLVYWKSSFRKLSLKKEILVLEAVAEVFFVACYAWPLKISLLNCIPSSRSPNTECKKIMKMTIFLISKFICLPFFF